MPELPSVAVSGQGARSLDTVYMSTPPALIRTTSGPAQGHALLCRVLQRGACRQGRRAAAQPHHYVRRLVREVHHRRGPREVQKPRDGDGADDCCSAVNVIKASNSCVCSVRSRSSSASYVTTSLSAAWVV